MVGNEVEEPWVTAWNAEPADGEIGAAVFALFEWTAAGTALLHDVHFWTSPTPNAGEFTG